MLNINVNNEFNFKSKKENDYFLLNDEKIQWDLIQIKERQFHIIHNNLSYNAEVISVDNNTKTFAIRINNNIYNITAKDKYDQLLKELGMDNLNASKVNNIKAPMPGLVLSVMVKEGDEIKKGDNVLVLEAMKMENVLKSPGDGKIKYVQVDAGNKVEKNQVMIVME